MRSIRFLLPVLLLLMGVCATMADEAAPGFSLTNRVSGKAVNLSEFSGKIVVLDFFAWWCGPCAKSAPVVEEQIRKHYAATKGNPHGVPVHVVGINVEEESPGNTDAFVRKHGLGTVLDDEDGKTLKSYGGAGLPFLVVIDGTRGTADAPVFRVVYKKAGFEGAAALRRVIDGIKAPENP